MELHNNVLLHHALSETLKPRTLLKGRLYPMQCCVVCIAVITCLQKKTEMDFK